MEDTALPPETASELADIGERDLVLAVLSYQHGRTIGGVVQALAKGATAHFPGARALIVHWDAGSSDGSVEAAAQAAAPVRLWTLASPAPTAPRALPPIHGVPGADAAFRTLCLTMRATGARALVLVGADLRSLHEDWVHRLLRPVWEEGLDLVVPRFARPVLDGPLTTCLLYPLTRALYGASVRNPVSTELGLSGGFAARLCEAPGWGSPASRSLSLFLATTAAATGAALGEVGLGPREEEPPETRMDLGEVVGEVVGAAFALAEVWEEQWRERRPGPPPRLLGDPLLLPSDMPPTMRARMVQVFRQGLRDLQPIWEQALAGGTLGDLYALGDLAPEEFAFPSELWARVVYDFLLAYRFRTLHRGHLLRSLVPLYLGRLAALGREAAGLAAPLQDRLVERQARAFEGAKGEVADRWR